MSIVSGFVDYNMDLSNSPSLFVFHSIFTGGCQTCPSSLLTFAAKTFPTVDFSTWNVPPSVPPTAVEPGGARKKKKKIARQTGRQQAEKKKKPGNLDMLWQPTANRGSGLLIP